MVELLSPVGDFECLKAAVQNGADAVYFGASLFSARAFAQNFDDEELKRAIEYAKLRGVKTHLTLNTLIKENEFEDAFNLAKKAYEYGIDAIIVQDLGLAKTLINSFHDLDIHASTQMTIHNLEGVKELEELGFKRAVLSRELSIDNIKYICENSNMEIETFIHGALCISYSGQCLLSSMIGSRSGNRGKCAQPCRLPYELIDKNENILDKGYLLSPRDLCGLKFIPELIKAGVSSFKIEGRMKTPEYVATVTRIYRKYIDLAQKSLDDGTITAYQIEDKDIQDLMQVFNRGGFSNGHLSNTKNQNLIFKEKPNNMGLYLGKIVKYNPAKGLVTTKLETPLSIGDTISFENENTKYTISELMENNSNIKTSQVNETVTFGRMKGNIHIGDKIFKIADIQLSNIAKNSYNKEYIKNQIDCKLEFYQNQKVHVEAYCANFDKSIDFIYDYIPEAAQNAPITKDIIIKQFNKTIDTCFEFRNLEIKLDDNSFIPVAMLNDIRRKTLSKIENIITNSFERKSSATIEVKTVKNNTLNQNPKISILFNTLYENFDFSKYSNLDKIYIPLKFFNDEKYFKLISNLGNKYDLYIYLPTIIKNDYTETTKKIIQDSLEKFKIKGVVVSNISELNLFPKHKLDIIGNYTLNVYNSHTIKKLESLGINTITISPELNNDEISSLCNCANLKKEIIVSGKIPVMTTNYCLLGKSNKCYDKCKHTCLLPNEYYLKDRIGAKFRVIPDNTQTISTIYNYKSTSIDYSDLNINSVRIDIL